LSLARNVLPDVVTFLGGAILLEVCHELRRNVAATITTITTSIYILQYPITNDVHVIFYSLISSSAIGKPSSFCSTEKDATSQDDHS